MHRNRLCAALLAVCGALQLAGADASAITQASAGGSSAQATPAKDISGTWVAKAETPMGELEIVYVLKVRDGHITGQQSLPFGDSPIMDGSVTGNTFHFTVALESFGSVSNREVSGRVVGDSLVLTPAVPGPPPDAQPTMPAGASPRPPFHIGEVTAVRGNPTPSYRAPAVDYAALPKLDLPVLHAVSYNGLARTPPMGWNSWNKFQTRINDATVRGIADAIVASGMKDAGYQYVIIDDGWQGSRDASGLLRPNPNFPDMKRLAEYVHAKGLKIGIYSSPGPRTCGGFEGSYGHESQDAQMYAAWEMDYLKYDWCSASRVWKDADMQAVYQTMGDALLATGRPIVYALCQYGRAHVEQWGPRVGGNLWRTTNDIRDSYESMTTIGFAQSGLASSAGPGHWNDPDMLEIGNGRMTDEEYRTHLSLWAMIAAPLIAGNDVRSMTPAIHDILTNREVLAVDQDGLGAGGRELYQEGGLRVWSKALTSGDIAIAVFNTGNAPAAATVITQRLGVHGGYIVRDLWQQKTLGALEADLRTNIAAHSVVMYRLIRKPTSDR